MLRQLYFILFLFILLCCKEDSDALLPQAYFFSIAGTWRLTEIEKGTFGQKYWEPANVKPSDNIIFIANGSVLDSDSLKRCCSPTSLLINGQLLDIPPSTTLAPNPICAVVNCVSCPTWEIEWKNDELIISYCDGSRQKYTRL